jgi:hypothetical protein
MKATSSVETPAGSATGRLARWQRRGLLTCAIVFTFEVGLFLLIFPWKSIWELSWVPTHSPGLAAVWLSPFFRGAVSGLGVLNIYIAVSESFKQLKRHIART